MISLWTNGGLGDAAASVGLTPHGHFHGSFLRRILV